jgi:hypothetical protein
MKITPTPLEHKQPEITAKYIIKPFNSAPYTHVIESEGSRFKAFLMEKDGRKSIEITPVTMSAENFAAFAKVVLKGLRGAA